MNDSLLTDFGGFDVSPSPNGPERIGDVLRSMPIQHELKRIPNARVRFTWEDLLAIDTSAPAMLLEGLLPSTEIALLAGDGGLGKSTLVRQLSIAIARGETSFLGQRLNVAHRRVIYVSCEDSVLKLARIFQRLPRPPWNGLVFLTGGNLTHKEIVQLIEVELERGPADLIVLDSIGNMLDGDQNSNSDAQDFFRPYSRISESALCLFLHHLRKRKEMTSVNRMHIQGAGAFVQRARAVLMLTQCGNSTDRLLTMAKENDVADDFKEQGLVIQFDRELKEYSSEGKRAPLAIARPETGRDVNEVFQENEVELKSKELVPRLMEMYSIQERQAKELLKRLTQVRHGVYRRTNRESAVQ